MNDAEPSTIWTVQARISAVGMFYRCVDVLGSGVGYMLVHWHRTASRDLIIQVDGNGILVARREGATSQQLGHVPRTKDFNLAKLTSLCEGQSPAVIVQIPADAVLKPRVAMPSTSRKKLRQALRYELPSVSPLDQDQVYFDFVVEKTASPASIVDVELRIVARRVVDEAVSICHAGGLEVGAFSFSGDFHEADRRAFPVDFVGHLRFVWRRLSVGILVLLSMLLLLSLAVAVYSRATSLRDLVNSDVETAHIQANSVENLSQEIHTVENAGRFLAREKTQPLFVSVIADISRSLPDDTWIDEIELHGHKIRLQGHSRSASALIAIFDRSERFSNAEFTAPLTVDAGHGGERFELSLDIVERP